MNVSHPYRSGSIPPLAALQAFERAASQLSFRLAARDLSLSPSAISHQIRGIEALFGIKLFLRGPRSVRLTAAGKRYLEDVSAALSTLDNAGREMTKLRRGTAGELRISALPFFTSTVLIPALVDFNRNNPNLTVRIEATHQYADFNNSNVDVAIRYGREQSSGLKFEPLVKVSGLAVCSPALKAELKYPRDLSRQVLLHLTSQPRAWPIWLSEAEVPDLTPRGHIWLDSVPAILEAAERGLGVALGMTPLIEARPGFGSTLVAPFNFQTRYSETLYLVYRSEQARDRRIMAARRWIVAAVRNTQRG